MGKKSQVPEDSNRMLPILQNLTKKKTKQAYYLWNHMIKTSSIKKKVNDEHKIEERLGVRAVRVKTQARRSTR